jgi:uncharacterized membrane protein
MLRGRHPVFTKINAWEDLDVTRTAQLRAEQAVTQRYGRTMPFFMSATITSFLPVLALSPARRKRNAAARLAGLLCYGVMLAITLIGNVPLNNHLLALSPDAPTTSFWRCVPAGPVCTRRATC